jgi:hypothetical protein
MTMNLRKLIFPKWKWPVSIGLFLFQFLTTVRDEFLSPSLRDKLQLIEVIKMIHWYWWIIAALIVWILITVLTPDNKTARILAVKDAKLKKITDERLKLTLRKIKLEKLIKSMPAPNTLASMGDKPQLEKELSEINTKIETLKTVDDSWQQPEDFMIAKCPRPTCMNNVEFHKKDINETLHCSECGVDFRYKNTLL